MILLYTYSTGIQGMILAACAIIGAAYITLIILKRKNDETRKRKS